MEIITIQIISNLKNKMKVQRDTKNNKPEKCKFSMSISLWQVIYKFLLKIFKI